MRDELNWLSEQIGVTTSRLYVEGQEAFATISLRLHYRTLRSGETGADKATQSFLCAMPPDTPEKFAG